MKDVGIAIYSRAMAERISRRLAELGDFAALEAAHARWLAKRHDLDYLITEHDIGLPLVHRRGPDRGIRSRRRNAGGPPRLAGRRQLVATRGRAHAAPFLST